MVGLIPLFASLVLKPAALANLQGFNKRMKWLLKHRKDLAKQVCSTKVDCLDDSVGALPSSFF